MANNYFSLNTIQKAVLRLFGLLLVLFLLFVGPLTRRAIASQEAPENLRAILISDLHFTLSEKVTNIIVPGMAYANALTDALVEEVIDAHPDLFIMTGDNTNDGDEEDVRVLVEKLRRIREAGIELIITTGNHDYHRSTMEDFRRDYFPLLEWTDLCPDSLSYTRLFKGVLWIAMDDNAASKGENGRFSQTTLNWLEAMLEKYRDYPKIFLTHHSLMLGKASKEDSPLHNQTQEVLSLLEREGVHLILTGHLHSQSFTKSGRLYELISSMPLGPNHYLGYLTLSGKEAHYQAVPLSLSRYGEEGLSQRVQLAEEEGAEFQKRSYAQTIDHSEYSRREKKEILGFFLKFLQYYGEGSLGKHFSEFTSSPLTPKMIHALWDYNYGPWIASVLESQPLDATFFRIQYMD